MRKFPTRSLFFDVLEDRITLSAVPTAVAFQANTFVNGDQMNSATAMDPARNVVVVWQSTDQDGDGVGKTNIYGQRYDALGMMVGHEFRINSVTTGMQSNPAVAMDS